MSGKGNRNKVGRLGTLVQRFGRKILVGDGCWEWIGCHNRLGYGQMRVDHKGVLAHRVAWKLFCGELPDELDVCHKCDNPKCVRPSHLFLGTALDNMRDMRSKGRQDWTRPQRGEGVGTSKLKQEDIGVIREMRRLGATYHSIGQKYGVTDQAIWLICKGKNWAHL